jgi:hypothetical protein
MKKLFTLINIFFCSTSIFAQQIIVRGFPQHGAFIARDKVSNVGNIQFTVSRDSTKIDSIRMVVLPLQGQSDTVFPVSHITSTTHSTRQYQYLFSYNIACDMVFKSFQLQYYNRSTLEFEPITACDSLLVGDVFIVQGQSNASARAYWGSSNAENQSEFIKSFGYRGNQFNINATLNDTSWRIANGDGPSFGSALVGQWALRMAKLLIDTIHVPICIVNGADPGKPITFFQRNDSMPLDSSTNYGRLLYRMQKSKLQNHARALFYYQGESDGANAMLHNALFDSLYRDWKNDYQALEQIYVFQVSDGCFNPSLALREYQRRFQDRYSDVKVLATTGVSAHDGCHFYYMQGYKTLGERAYLAVLEDLYLKTNASNTHSINIESAVFDNDYHNSITVTFDSKNDSLYIDNMMLFLLDLKIEGDSVYIYNGEIVENQLKLLLSRGTTKGMWMSYNGHAYGNPGWLKGANNQSLLTFNYFPLGWNIPLAIEVRDYNNILLDNTVTASWRIEDKNNELQKFKVMLFNANNELLSHQEVSKSIDGLYWHSFELNNCGSYYTQLHAIQNDGTVKYYNGNLVNFNDCNSKNVFNIVYDAHFKNIALQYQTANDINLHVYDMNGKVLWSQIVPNTTQLTNLDLPLNHLPAGVYIIHGANEHESFNKKLTVF